MAATCVVSTARWPGVGRRACAIARRPCCSRDSNPCLTVRPPRLRPGCTGPGETGSLGRRPAARQCRSIVERLIFRGSRSGTFDIYLMDPIGGPTRNLTNHAAKDVFPAFSPQGDRIAFASDRDHSMQGPGGVPTLDFYTLDLHPDGSTGHPRRITRTPARKGHVPFNRPSSAHSRTAKSTRTAWPTAIRRVSRTTSGKTALHSGRFRQKTPARKGTERHETLSGRSRRCSRRAGSSPACCDRRRSAPARAYRTREAGARISTALAGSWQTAAASYRAIV
jgi:hypothetical protein